LGRNKPGFGRELRFRRNDASTPPTCRRWGGGKKLLDSCLNMNLIEAVPRVRQDRERGSEQEPTRKGKGTTKQRQKKRINNGKGQRLHIATRKQTNNGGGGGEEGEEKKVGDTIVGERGGGRALRGRR